MITSDEKNWAATTNDGLYEIAKNWAKKYNTKNLRSFQSWYDEIRLGLPVTTEEERFRCYENMWQCATFAISIREFGA
jgi:hypothetical protein